jgi:chromosome segregation ATPase
MSVNDREAILTAISEKRNILQAKKKSICTMEQMKSEKQVAISRLLKEKLDLQHEMNNFILKLSGDLKNFIDFEIEPLSTQFTEDNLDEIGQVLKEVEVVYTGALTESKNETMELSNKLATLELELKAKQVELDVIQKQVHELTEQRSAMHDDHVKSVAENQRKLDEMQKLSNQLTEENKAMEAQTKRNEQTLAVLKQQLNTAMENNMTFMDERIREKEDDVMALAKKFGNMKK